MPHWVDLCRQRDEAARRLRGEQPTDYIVYFSLYSCGEIPVYFLKTLEKCP